MNEEMPVPPLLDAIAEGHEDDESEEGLASAIARAHPVEDPPLDLRPLDQTLQRLQQKVCSLLEAHRGEDDEPTKDGRSVPGLPEDAGSDIGALGVKVLHALRMGRVGLEPEVNTVALASVLSGPSASQVASVQQLPSSECPRTETTESAQELPCTIMPTEAHGQNSLAEQNRLLEQQRQDLAEQLRLSQERQERLERENEALQQRLRRTEPKSSRASPTRGRRGDAPSSPTGCAPLARRGRPVQQPVVATAMIARPPSPAQASQRVVAPSSMRPPSPPQATQRVVASREEIRTSPEFRSRRPATQRATIPVMADRGAVTDRSSVPRAKSRPRSPLTTPKSSTRELHRSTDAADAAAGSGLRSARSNQEAMAHSVPAGAQAPPLPPPTSPALRTRLVTGTTNAVPAKSSMRLPRRPGTSNGSPEDVRASLPQHDRQPATPVMTARASRPNVETTMRSRSGSAGAVTSRRTTSNSPGRPARVVGLGASHAQSQVRLRTTGITSLPQAQGTHRLSPPKVVGREGPSRDLRTSDVRRQAPSPSRTSSSNRS